MSEDYKGLITETWEFVDKYVAHSGYKLNPDEEVLNMVIEGLARNKALHGKRYCPCRLLSGKLEEDKAKICPCKWHKDEIVQNGMCHCQLYFANNE